MLNNPHVQTIIPALFAQGSMVYRRETINTYDNDFLDLDWAHEKQNKLVIYVHGMEGSSEDWYIKRCGTCLADHGYSTLVINLRGCSDSKQTPKKTYHSGMSEDLSVVIDHLLANYNYHEINLVGFSIGGNIVLKYLAEQSQSGSEHLKYLNKAVVFSAPLDLKSSADALAQAQGKIYMRHLMYKLGKKLNKNLLHIKSFHEYDRLYTAPTHGFLDEHDYWQQASSKKLLKNIRKKTLIVSAADDPFLGPECFPYEEVAANPYLSLKVPEYGGHLGFMQVSWKQGDKGSLLGLKLDFKHEQYVLEFLMGENK